MRLGKYKAVGMTATQRGRTKVEDTRLKNLAKVRVLKLCVLGKTSQSLIHAMKN